MLAMSHLKAFLSDPGTVPLSKQRVDFTEFHSKTQIEREKDEWTVCSRCETYRPPRAHHCRICKRCIRRMDHHCPWINNCVGERNQKYFLQFLVYVGALSIYSVCLVVSSWVTPCDNCPNENLPEAQARMLHCVLLLLESALFGLFVIAIMFDQLSAIFSDETAIEAIQNRGPYRSTRQKMALLREICGRGHPLLWLLPCRTTSTHQMVGDTGALLSYDI